MKIKVLLSLLMYINCYGSDTLKFSDISVAKALISAQQQNKAVLLYFHFDGCAPCAKMEKEVFTDSRVAEYYNANFISINVNTTPATGKEIANTYGVRINPAFIYLDNSGKELHRVIGSSDAEGFLRKGKNALSATNSLAHYKRRYLEGGLSSESLYDYIYLLKDAKELTPEVLRAYLETQDNDVLDTEKNVRLIYEFCFHNHKPYILFGSREYDFMADNVDLFANHFEKEQVEVRLCIIAIESANKIIEDGDEAKFIKLASILQRYRGYEVYDFKEMDGRITFRITNNGLLNFLKLSYYRKQGNKKLYDASLEDYLVENSTNPKALDRLAWDYYKNYEDNPNLQKAIQWSRKSIDIQPGYLNHKTYASLLYKTGNTKEALQQAQEAIRLAELNGYSYKEVTELIEKIKKGE